MSSKPVQFSGMKAAGYMEAFHEKKLVCAHECVYTHIERRYRRPSVPGHRATVTGIL